MLAFQLIFNAAILMVCLYTLLVVYRAVQKQEEEILHETPYEMFDQEPRSNPWVNFLQEPIKKLSKGRTGTFKSYEKELKNSPVYMIT